MTAAATHVNIPEWFTSALAVEPTVGRVGSAGASIAYRSWGEPGDRNILLIHGGAAHSRWWDHVAPLLATGRRVVALDLSGHGDSDHRQAYSLDIWAQEAHDVASAAGLGDSPYVIGHSLGGLVTLRLASTPGARFGGAIVVDSPIAPPGSRHQDTGESDEFASVRRRIYASEDEAMGRFRPVPAQSSLPYVRDYIARNSLREVDGGWTWKFDPRIFDDRAALPAILTEVHCPVAFFRAEHGLESPRLSESLEGAGIALIEIPDAGHAPMLDLPLALVTGIRSVLAEWQRI